jgi:glutaminyl-tRNA synthetase
MEERSLNFLEEIIENHLAEGKYKSIHTRFPPNQTGICIWVMQPVSA